MSAVSRFGLWTAGALVLSTAIGALIAGEVLLLDFLNQLDQLQRLYEGADYYHEEPERKWSKRWTIFYGICATWAVGAVAYVAWRHFGG